MARITQVNTRAGIPNFSSVGRSNVQASGMISDAPLDAAAGIANAYTEMQGALVAEDEKEQRRLDASALSSFGFDIKAAYAKAKVDADSTVDEDEITQLYYKTREGLADQMAGYNVSNDARQEMSIIFDNASKFAGVSEYGSKVALKKRTAAAYERVVLDSLTSSDGDAFDAVIKQVDINKYYDNKEGISDEEKYTLKRGASRQLANEFYAASELKFNDPELTIEEADNIVEHMKVFRNSTEGFGESDIAAFDSRIATAERKAHALYSSKIVDYFVDEVTVEDEQGEWVQVQELNTQAEREEALSGFKEVLGDDKRITGAEGMESAAYAQLERRLRDEWRQRDAKFSSELDQAMLAGEFEKIEQDRRLTYNQKQSLVRARTIRDNANAKQEQLDLKTRVEQNIVQSVNDFDYANATTEQKIQMAAAFNMVDPAIRDVVKPIFDEGLKVAKIAEEEADSRLLTDWKKLSKHADVIFNVTDEALKNEKFLTQKKDVKLSKEFELEGKTGLERIQLKEQWLKGLRDIYDKHKGDYPKAREEMDKYINMTSDRYMRQMAITRHSKRAN